MSFRKRLGTVGFAAVVVLGTSSVLHAQDALTSTSAPKTSTSQSKDADLMTRVKNALHADPVLYDKHIDVSMEKGNVVLKGFVASSQDLQKAVRAATGAAGDRKVVNNLTIKEGGDGGAG